MLDTIKIGLLRLDTKGGTLGYMRVVSKSNPNEVTSHFRIPLNVAFDLEGYNTYKDYVNKQNPEFKTWIHNIAINVPPKPENAALFPKSGHEWFLGHLRDLSRDAPNFPQKLKKDIDQAIKEYVAAKQLPKQEEYDDWDAYADERPMTEAEKVAAAKAMYLYGKIQRSRFDPGREGKRAEFTIRPFFRAKEDKMAKEIIEEVTEAVAHYVWRNPKFSKYSETQGPGLKIKLTILFMECFYKEQIRFMRKKLGVPGKLSMTRVRRKN